MTKKIAVVGALGRMGSGIIKELEKDKKFELVLAVDNKAQKKELIFRGKKVPLKKRFTSAESKVDIIVDFSQRFVPVYDVLPKYLDYHTLQYYKLRNRLM